MKYDRVMKNIYNLFIRIGIVFITLNSILLEQFPSIMSEVMDQDRLLIKTFQNDALDPIEHSYHKEMCVFNIYILEKIKCCQKIYNVERIFSFSV